MRVNKKREFEAISARSVGKDFPRKQMYPTTKRVRENGNSDKITTHSRVARINEICEYAKFARFFIGRLVELVEPKGENTTTGWYSFVHDSDRKALNEAAGWSDNKRRYLLERPKFK